MKVLFSKKFSIQLENIYVFISKDSNLRAKQFVLNLERFLLTLEFMPNRYRISRFTKTNKNLRETVFKGYVITYILSKNKVVVLDIFKFKKS